MVTRAADVNDVAVLNGMYCTIIVHVPPGATTVPVVQVPPVIEKVPRPETLATMGAAVSVNEPAFAPVAMLLTVMVPVFVVVVAGIVVIVVGRVKVTVATPVLPVVPVTTTAPASVAGPPFLGLS